MKWIGRSLRVGLLGFIGAQGDVALPNQHLAAGLMEGEQAVGACDVNPNVSLVQRIRDGDHSAEEEMLKIYLPGVFLIAVARTRNQDEARDLTQETAIAVLKALRAGHIRESNKLAAFIQG